MIRRFLVAAAILLTAFSYAQNNAASPYSFYGIGDLKFKGTIENRMMGGISMYSDSIHLNLNNPASFSKLKITTFGVAANQSFLDLEDESGTERASSTSLNYIALGLPLGKIGAFGFGLLPYTSVGYKLEGLNADQTVLNRFQGQGGLNRAFLSYGIQVFKGFSVGATANYNFGNIENTRITVIQGIELATKQSDESAIGGFDFNLAANYERKLGKKLTLTSSFVFKPQTDLTSENERQIATLTFSGTGSELIRDIENVNLGSLAETKLTLPQTMTFGLGLGEEKKWFLGAEYSILDNEELGGGFALTSNASYIDGSRFSAGGFFIPQYDSFTSYWNRVVYRAGIRYEETGLVLNNLPINDFGISFGVGLPLSGFSNVNLGFELGQRGTAELGRIKENYFNLNIGLSLSDKWFIKRKYN